MMRLWFCLHLPLLQLEALLPRWCEAGLYVVLEQERVIQLSALSRQAGVQIGMRRAGVAALAPATLMLERKPEREHASLQAAAYAMLQFTPEVCYADDGSILMDVSASLRAFGGVLALCRRVRRCIATLGYSLQLGVAPTASGAWLLARVESLPHPSHSSHSSLRRRVLSLSSLHAQLDLLPFHILPAALPYAACLQGLGCTTLAALRRLPRSGLSRRTHPSVLTALDKAYGNASELFEWISLPQRFSARLETYDRIEHSQALMYGVKSLLLQMLAWLVSAKQAVMAYVFFLEHERGRSAIPATALEIRLAQASWHEAHLLPVVQERLAKLELIAPVIALRLETLETVAMAPRSDSLFPEPGGKPEDFQRLLDLLSARLGPDNICIPAAKADHRPELANAWHSIVASTRVHEQTLPGRPFWLLAQPQALMLQNERPYYGSPLTLIQGPERIESGWWDDASAVRDYFIAQADNGACYWIFQQRHPQVSWYLHGLFA